MVFAVDAAGRMNSCRAVLLSILAGVVPGLLDAQEPFTLKSMNHNVNIASAEFSPTAPEMAVLTNRSGSLKIWLMAADGSNSRMLIEDDQTEASPVWSPDGRRIAFLRITEGTQDIWAVNRDGDDLRRITHDPEGERTLAWGPLGRRIAFLSDRSGHQDVFVVDVESGTVEQITSETNPWDESRWAPVWSPDGGAIAYVSNRSEPWADDVWLAELETGVNRKLTAGLHVMSTPIWSPDGRLIAFNAVRESEFWYGDQSDIYLVTVATGDVERLDMNTHVSDGNGGVRMAWAPDSQSIFFR